MAQARNVIEVSSVPMTRSVRSDFSIPVRKITTHPTMAVLKSEYFLFLICDSKFLFDYSGLTFVDT
jgi:hypothetical protein